MKKLVKINTVKNNPNNPRIIKNDKFKKLVQSIKEFPQMLELRPIIVDEDNVILGGNMRHKASIEAGLKEVWIDVAKDLNEEQKKEFIIKDNVNFGDWEWDMLANEWSSTELSDWGLGVWQNSDENWNEDIEIPDIEEITDFTESVNFLIRCENLEQLEILKSKLNTQATKLSYNDFIKRLK